MDVRCDQCGIIYEFEDERVQDTGLTVKCTSCGHIFKVFPAATKTAEPEPYAGVQPVDRKESPAPLPSSGDKQVEKRWLIRKPSGEIFKFRELTTLQQWIVEQKVSREDEISRTGKVWERLGAIKELEPFFRVVDMARAAEESPRMPANIANVRETALADEPFAKPAPARPDLLESRTEPEGMARVHLEDSSEPFAMGEGAAPTSSEPAFPTGKLRIGDSSAGQEAAWERGESDSTEPSRADSISLAEDELASVRRGGGMGRVLLISLLGLAIGGGLVVLWTNWDAVRELFAGKSSPASGSYAKGRRAFLTDTEASFKRALVLYQQVYQSSSSKVTTAQRADARAGQAEVHAAWAQYLKDDAQDLQRTALALEKGRVGGTAANDPGPLRARAKKLLLSAKEHATEALRLARSAHLMAQNLRTKRAEAEASRVAGLPLGEVHKLVKAAERLAADDPELLYTKAMLAYDLGKLERAQKLLRTTIALWNRKSSEPFLRAQMRLARVYYLRARRSEAMSVLQSITAKNPGHARAQRLLDKLKADSKAVAIKTTAQDAGVPDATPGGSSEPAMRAAPGEVTEPGGDYDSLVRKAGRFSYGGNSARALKYYRKALKLKPSGVEALTGVGYCFMDLRQTGRAISSFRKALAVSGAYGEALIGVAEAYQRSGRLKQSLRFYKRYLRHHPSGRRAVLAKQNIKELEDKLSKSTGASMDAQPAMDRPAAMISQPVMDRPASMDVSPPTVREPPRRAPPMVREPPRRAPPMVREPPRRAPPMIREPPPAMR